MKIFRQKHTEWEDICILPNGKDLTKKPEVIFSCKSKRDAIVFQHELKKLIRLHTFENIDLETKRIPYEIGSMSQCTTVCGHMGESTYVSGPFCFGMCPYYCGNLVKEQVVLCKYNGSKI